MNLRNAVFAWAMFSAVTAGAQPVYKCQEKGTITYTDQPCPGGAQAAELPGLIVAQPPARSQQDLARAWDSRIARDQAVRDKADVEWLQQHHNRRDREERVHRAIVAHQVIKSMTRDEVRLALGEPDHVDSGDSYGTPKETWTYVMDGQKRTVNFKDGEVTTTVRKGKRDK